MKKYVIKKGNHYSWHLPRLWIGRKDSMDIQVRFHKDCWFPMKDRDDYAINKLCGWSYGFHHNNSIRIGWTPSDARENWIEIYLYVYTEQMRKEYYVGLVECDIINKIRLSYDSMFSIINCSLQRPLTVDNATLHAKLKRTWWGALLFPYFGGIKTAPTDIHIDLSFE